MGWAVPPEGHSNGSVGASLHPHGDEPDIISYGLDGKEGGTAEDADILSWKNK